jgi:RNA polymerase sigma-32 factor
MEPVRRFAEISEGQSRFMRAVHAFPLLSAEAERELFCRWRDHHDVSAAHLLASSYLRLVVKIARAYRGYGLPPEDLIGEGHVGMMRAICRFDPDRAVRFSAYAVWWIRAAMQEYIVNNWSLVRIATTAAQRKLFFNLRRLRRQLEQYDESTLRSEHASEIADQLKVPKQEVVKMSERLAGRDCSLNAPVGEDGDGEWLNLLADDQDDPETVLAKDQEAAHRRSILPVALLKLSSRERAIVMERRLKETPARLDDLSQQFGISRERIRQIEIRALSKLRRAAELAGRVTARAEHGMTAGRAAI